MDGITTEGSKLSLWAWQEDNPEGTLEQYNRRMSGHNFLHWESQRERMPCPFGRYCPGMAPEPNWGLLERTWDRLTGREDPWRNYDIYN